MDYLVTAIVWTLLGVGSVFYVIGALGLMRMPDVFTRAHAVSVSDTLGAGALLLGMMIAAGWSLVTAKLVFILAILLFTGAVATHALSRAALTAGVVPKLAEDRARRRDWREGPAVRRRHAAKSGRKRASGRGKKAGGASWKP